METKIKFVKKPAPIKNALLVCSLTCNAFLGMAAYAVYNGQLVKTSVVTAQPVELYEEDYLINLARRQ